jgi:NAD(P)-dependent dehydrogenase (short-subunit alcohol dehydrogenase family)
MDPAIRFDGTVAVVCGATGGWGGGTAMVLARRGAAVVLNARTQSKLDALARRIERAGGTAIGVAQDVSTFDGAQKLIDRAVEEYGRVDVLMHAAGVRAADPAAKDKATAREHSSLYGGTLLEVSPQSWDFVLTSELTSVCACAKAAALQMVAQGDGGAIIAVVGNIVSAPSQSAHAAAKAGLMAALRSWADELAPQGITVNGVRGYVRSLLTDQGFDIEAHDFDVVRTSPALPTEPGEAGELVAWLASPDAATITGTYIGIDGARATYWEPRLPEVAVFNHPSWSAEDLARSFGPVIRRRPPRPSMNEVVQDLFSAHDLARAAKAREGRS